MGVDVIEAGFPIASKGDFEAVHEIAKLRQGQRGLRPGARRRRRHRPRLARRCSRPARKRIHTFIGTSPLHCKYQLQIDAEQVHQA